MNKITPFLWFNNQAEAAASHYVSIFNNSSITHIAYYGTETANVSGRTKDSVMTVSFELEGQPFIALNGGPLYQLTPAISFMVNVDSQHELDSIWDKLVDGGSVQQCGWLTDKFGITWQIIPSILGQLLHSPDPARSQRVMRAMLQMKKIDITNLHQAYEQ